MSSKKLMLAQRALRVGEAGGGVDLTASDRFSRYLAIPDGATEGVCSFWIYRVPGGTVNILRWQVDYQGGARYSDIYVTGAGQVGVELWGRIESKGSAYTAVEAVPLYQWSHVAISWALAGSAEIYVNDVARLYRNNLRDTHAEGALMESTYRVNDASLGDCRLAQLLFDTRRYALYSAATRRLFSAVDPERGLIPAADQQALSPVIYLPLDDSEAWGKNLGAGGDFSQHGVMAQSQIGPSDYSAAATQFADDSLTGSLAVEAKNALLAFGFRADGNAEFIRSGNELQVGYNSGRLYIELRRLGTGSAALVMRVSVPLYMGVMYSIQLSVDMASTDRRHLIINGADVTASAGWDVYVDQAYQVSGAVAVGGQSSVLSGLYFDSCYIDISHYNPFFDVGTGKLIGLGENGELPTGSSPLIYLPMDASKPGANLGTGGDFAENGTFTGARGPSEYWARSAEFGGGYSYLKNSQFRMPRTSALTLVVALNPAQINGGLVRVSGKSQDLLECGLSDGCFLLQGRFEQNASAVSVRLKSSIRLEENNPGVYLISFDLASAGCRYFSCNGKAGGVWEEYEVGSCIGANDGSWNFLGNCQYVGQYDVQGAWTGGLGFLYLSDKYVDFSIEKNQLKFIDAFGYPVDIQPAIDSGDIPEPLIHMKFDDPAALGFNSGTGGDFVINGTVTPGADVGA